MSYLYRTDNPIADFDRYDREQSRRLARLPKCAICREPIQQEYAVCIDGVYYCGECLDDLKEYLDDLKEFIEERSDET